MFRRADFLDIQRQESHLADEMRGTMAARPRSLPPGMALDAAGHALYARVTALPAYSSARAELELLRTEARDIFAMAGHPLEIVDLQAGTATQARPLLDLARGYVAVDRCAAVVDDAVEGVAAAFPQLYARGIVGDSYFGLGATMAGIGPHLILMLGGTIGRLDPTEARLELARIRSLMAPADCLLIGMDLEKEERRLFDAYNDPTDIYDAYARNVLRRANREVGTDFYPIDWRTVVEVQPSKSRVEVRLEARRTLTVKGGLAGGYWDFRAGESLIVEHHYKPSEGQVAAMALGAGFRLSRVWNDCNQGFALFLLRP